MYHTIFFDLDNTIYPQDSGIWEAISENINKYLKNYLRMPESEIPVFREYCRSNFGSTLLALKDMYSINDQEYLDCVHNIDLSNHLSDDGSMRKLLLSLSQEKYIFTNADLKHAERILDFFHIQDCFKEIIDYHRLSPFVKPHTKAFTKALEISGRQNADGCVFIDDYLPNIIKASEMGFHSLHIVSKNKASQHNPAFTINNIYELNF